MPLTESTKIAHNDMANAIRALAMDAVEKAKSGHPGMPLGMADVATVLFTKFLKFNPQAPLWPDRDRFILSAGHGSMLQYALLYLLGYEKISLDDIKNFRTLNSICAGHPEVEQDAGIETTTGPLGQGIATAVGFALAEKIMAAKYGTDLVDHYTYVIAGDGCLMEGISHEAASLAGHLKLEKLIVLYDDNGITIDGPTDISFTDDTLARFRAYGWETHEIDGHNPKAIARAIEYAKTTDAPSLIACKTTIGYGTPTKSGKSSAHGSPLGEDEIKGTRQALNWPYAPFEIPANILAAWRDAGLRNTQTYDAWNEQLEATEDALAEKFIAAMNGQISENFATLINEFKKATSDAAPKVATRAASGHVLEKLVPAMDNLIGGSADLTGSNLTFVKEKGVISPDDFSGQYIYYGVREHGMAAAMNGLSLHGGLIPYGGTFLSFADYSRPAIRLGALMGQRVVHVMTHDSIGLGEDGPTHQPVEQIPSLRAMPNLHVFRPADQVETAEAWALALTTADTPSVLALTRQALPTVRTEHTEENLTAKGAYILQEAKDGAEARQLTLIATGSEVEIALKAQEKLEEDGIQTAVISMPCAELFDLQPASYQEETLGKDSLPKIAIEAAGNYGWEKYIGRKGRFIGMNGFGASAPIDVLYEHFGITPTHIVKAAKEIL